MVAPGRANEAGSVYRRGVAAFLASAGMAGYPALRPDSAAYPVGLDLETDEPTDDLTCTLSDGTSWYIAAKRGCGDDNQFQTVVDGWVRQLPTLGEGDRVVLAVGATSGVVRDLRDALIAARTGTRTYSAPHRDALAALRRRLGATNEDVMEELTSRATVLVVDADGPGHPQFETAAAWLSGSVTKPGDAPAAMLALAGAAHLAAGRSHSSTVDDWMRTVRTAGIPILGGPTGSVAATRQATYDAVERYRFALASNDGNLDLGLLADDLLTFNVPDLADHLRVAVDDGGDRTDERGLLDLVRRWPRVLLLGLPGAGKSTALTQVAARWAKDPDAPLPVHVQLRAVAHKLRHKVPMSLGLLCTAAASVVDPADRAALADTMVQRCRNGEAVLLLDGLDEAMGLKATMAAGLVKILDDIAPGTGVVLTARASAKTTAARLHLPTAQLLPPLERDAVNEALLRHAATVRSPANVEKWVEARLEWLSDSFHAHEDLAEVPLLVTLLTLVAADSDVDRLPGDRTSLLIAALRHSVDRWEEARGLPAAAGVTVSAEELLEGFAAIGRHLSTTQTSTPNLAEREVRQILTRRWSAPPAVAEQKAAIICQFWDTDMGIFPPCVTS